MSTDNLKPTCAFCSADLSPLRRQARLKSATTAANFGARVELPTLRRQAKLNVQFCPRCGAAVLFTRTPETARALLATALNLAPEALAVCAAPAAGPAKRDRDKGFHLVCAWDPDEWLTIPQVMKIMGVTSSTPIKYHLAAGHFPGAELGAPPEGQERGPGRPGWRIPRRAVFAHLRGQETAPDVADPRKGAKKGRKKNR